MLFQINFKSPKPVYLQLVDQVKAAAASSVRFPNGRFYNTGLRIAQQTER